MSGRTHESEGGPAFAHGNPEHNQHFSTFAEWVNKASSWLTRHPDYDPESYRAICFDQKGRLCRRGDDFMRARDDGAFPIHWVWPDQVPFLFFKGES